MSSKNLNVNLTIKIRDIPNGVSLIFTNEEQEKWRLMPNSITLVLEIKYLNQIKEDNGESKNKRN